MHGTWPPQRPTSVSGNPRVTAQGLCCPRQPDCNLLRTGASHIVRRPSAIHSVSATFNGGHPQSFYPPSVAIAFPACAPRVFSLQAGSEEPCAEAPSLCSPVTQMGCGHESGVQTAPRSADECVPEAFFNELSHSLPKPVELVGDFSQCHLSITSSARTVITISKKLFKQRAVDYIHTTQSGLHASFARQYVFTEVKRGLDRRLPIPCYPRTRRDVSTHNDLRPPKREVHASSLVPAGSRSSWRALEATL